MLHGKHILIVDDNAVNRQIQKKLVVEWGMIPHVFESPANIMAHVTELKQVEVAMLDMDMPELDGLGLARLLKQWYPELPILILSSIGDFTKDDILFATMTKPVRQESLKHVLIRAFERSIEPKQLLSVDLRESSETLSPLEVKQMRILLVEDNPVNQKVANMMLKRLGYTTVVVGNGLEAIESVKTGSYDVVLMDINMPEMDGIEATQKIRSMIDQDKQPWIIALTANAMEGAREKFLNSGMDDYLSKPIRVEDLQKTLRNVEDKSASYPD